MTNRPEPMHTALLLPGGGARAAYQVGVIKALSNINGGSAKNPYPIMCGTSAGAINAVTLASRSRDFAAASANLERLWLNLETDKVYRSDWWGILGNARRLFMSLFNDGHAVGRPIGLLDNRPLRKVLRESIDFSQIGQNIVDGHLHALSITAIDYTLGNSVSFYQGGPPGTGWHRWRRSGVPTPIELRHLLASTAIPTLFAPQRVGRRYFGDGALRQLAPISPALHLGARKVLIIPANGHRKDYAHTLQRPRPPSFGQIIGHLLNSAFVDAIEADIERLSDINTILEVSGESAVNGGGRLMQPIQSMVISPSEDIDALADEHVGSLPKSIRALLHRTGSERTAGGINVASFLLFTPGFCKALIELGYADGMRQETELRAFLAANPDQLSPV